MDRPVRMFSNVLLLVVSIAVFALLAKDATVYQSSHQILDSRTYRAAGEVYAGGRSPYPSPALVAHPGLHRNKFFVYPAPMAAIFAPLSVIPFSVVAVVWVLAALVALAGSLRLMGVRDWRSWMVLLLAPPVLRGVFIETLSPFLLLAACALWRFRDRTWVAASLAAFLFVSELFLWPVLVWLALSGRFRTALRGVVLAMTACVIAWAPIGYASLGSYVSVLRALAASEGPLSYQPVWLVSSSPRTSDLALVLVGVVGVLVLAWLCRKGQDRAAFDASLVVALAASPIVWGHYLVLLIPLLGPVFWPAWAIAWLGSWLPWIVSGYWSAGSSVAAVAVVAAAAVMAIRVRTRPVANREMRSGTYLMRAQGLLGTLDSNRNEGFTR